MLCIIVLALIAIFAFCFVAPKREGYGQLRSVKKIPFSNCADICNQYYRKCVQDDPDGDHSGWCETRFGDACVSECYYSNYHRTR